MTGGLWRGNWIIIQMAHVLVNLFNGKIDLLIPYDMQKKKWNLILNVREPFCHPPDIYRSIITGNRDSNVQVGGPHFSPLLPVTLPPPPPLTQILEKPWRSSTTITKETSRPSPLKEMKSKKYSTAASTRWERVRGNDNVCPSAPLKQEQRFVTCGSENMSSITQ